MIKSIYQHPFPFELESGATLPQLQICYHTSHPHNEDNKPVVWICHALTANSDAEDWWPGLVGHGKLFDPDTFFIVCANIIGSSYGSTSPLCINPDTGKPWLQDFPLVTVRDWARAHELLRNHLGIKTIHTLIGGSIGGFQSMEWAIEHPQRFQHLVLLVTSYYSNPWSIAINQAERMAMEADASFFSGDPQGGKAGLAAARAIGMLSYRGYQAFNLTQSETGPAPIENFRAATYQQHQGLKLANRFSCHCFHSITRSQDTHHVGRNRHSIQHALAAITARTLVIGVTSDILFPPAEQHELSAYIPHAQLTIIESAFGHDGFLIENQIIAQSIQKFWNQH